MVQLFDSKTKFENWLTEMQPALRRFIASLPQTIQAKLDFSSRSLDVLEQWAIESFANPNILVSPDNRETWDGLARYIGETFRRELGGRWNMRLDNKRYAFYGIPEIRGDSETATPDCPHLLATAAVDRRKGSFLRTIIENSKEQRSQQKPSPSGSPPFAAPSTVWFVMFDRPLPSISEVADFLKALRGWNVQVVQSAIRDKQQEHIQVKDKDSLVVIGINHDQAVLTESQEIAREFGSGRTDKVNISMCDKRFEVSFELTEDMINFNAACVVEKSLRDYLGGKGITFMPEMADFA